MAIFKFTIQQPNMLDAHFDSLDELNMLVEEIMAKGGTYKFINNEYNEMMAAQNVVAEQTPVAQAPAAYRPVAAKKHYCASCKRGDIKVEADVYVQGRIESNSGKMIPYRAYLCEEHLNLMGDIGNDGSLKVKML